MAKYLAENMQFGLLDPLPLRGFPPGKVRLRLRHDSFAQAFVRDETSTRHFHIEEVDGFWQPGLEMARNIKESFIIFGRSMGKTQSMLGVVKDYIDGANIRAK